MNGPDHYRMAEKHIDYAQDSDNTVVEQLHLGYAQAHATLALAAATALPDNPHGTRSLNGKAWSDAAGTNITRTAANT